MEMDMTVAELEDLFQKPSFERHPIRRAAAWAVGGFVAGETLNVVTAAPIDRQRLILDGSCVLLSVIMSRLTGK